MTQRAGKLFQHVRAPSEETWVSWIKRYFFLLLHDFRHPGEVRREVRGRNEFPWSNAVKKEELRGWPGFDRWRLDFGCPPRQG